MRAASHEDRGEPLLLNAGMIQQGLYLPLAHTPPSEGSIFLMLPMLSLLPAARLRW